MPTKTTNNNANNVTAQQAQEVEQQVEQQVEVQPTWTPDSEHTAELFQSVKNARIEMISTIKDNDDRVIITLNKPFLSLDENGKVCEVKTFGLHTYALMRQVAAQTQFTKVAQALLMGAQVPAEIMAMELTGANVNVKRTFAAAGSNRKSGEGVYETDCVTSEINIISTNVDEVAQMMLIQELKDIRKAQKEREQAKTTVDWKAILAD